MPSERRAGHAIPDADFRQEIFGLPILAAASAEAREEGWFWWFATVAGLAIALLVVMAVRRRLVRPMPLEPSDTTDAWAEAGRRLKVPKAQKPGEAASDDKESP